MKTLRLAVGALVVGTALMLAPNTADAHNRSYRHTHSGYYYPYSYTGSYYYSYPRISYPWSYPYHSYRHMGIQPRWYPGYGRAYW